MAPAAAFASARVPSPLTPLVGGQGRVESAWQVLSGTRLLTLTGTGGCGKTRLAMELASRADTAAWVELAPLTDPALLAGHVATTLGISDRGGRPTLALLVERLRHVPFLLVLDNCEHLVDAAATLVTQLLRDCPDVKVLATSREALGVAGERTWIVPPLPIDDAIELFAERAQAVRSAFAVTDRNRAAVARICQRLDGIPLAIELVAARVRALDPVQLAERLDSSLALLDTASRAALPRHRTLRETIDWSHRLLTDEERRLLRRLSVFHGTFSLEAVEGVCADAGTASSTLDLLTGLLDKSLLLCDSSDAGTRYRLLETVREYAAERLAEAGETDALRERHARFFVAWAERAAPAIFGGAADDEVMARLDADIVNLRDAHDWCEQQTSRLPLALRLAVALHWYWYARGLFNEGRMRVGVALTFAEGLDPLLRGRALTVLGRLAIWQGDDAHVHGPMEEAVDVLRPLGDHASLAYALQGFGIAAALQGRVSEARRLIDEAASLPVTDAPPVLGVWVEYWRGLCAEWDNDPDTARQHFERALAIAQRLDHRPAIAHALCVLGRLAASAGQLERAAADLADCLRRFREIEDRWGMAFALQGLARVAARSGRGGQAAELLGASDALRDELAIDLTPGLRGYQDETMATALAQVGEPAFWCAWTDGRKRRLEDIVASEVDPAAATADVPLRPQPAGVQGDLRIDALGPLEVHVLGRRVGRTEWGSNRARELLVYFACHPNGCTKAQIGLALWPDASPPQLRNSFHVTLHRLRTALRPADAVITEDDRYRLNPALSCAFDAAVFERETGAALRALRDGRDAAPALAAALALYRGDFLSTESPGDWADARRERLHHLYLDALDSLGRAHMERGRYLEAAEQYRTLLAVDPVNEEACRRLMVSLGHAGDRAAALRAFDALARALRDELDVAPDRETLAIRDSLHGSSAAHGQGEVT